MGTVLQPEDTAGWPGLRQEGPLNRGVWGAGGPELPFRWDGRVLRWLLRWRERGPQTPQPLALLTQSRGPSDRPLAPALCVYLGCFLRL